MQSTSAVLGFFKKYIMQMTEPRQSCTEGQRLHTVCNLKQQTCITYPIKYLSYLGLMGLFVLFCCLEAAEVKAGGLSTTCICFLGCIWAQLR